MKNFKNIAFGLMVGALAISFSAFTSPKKLSGDWYLPTSTISGTSPARLDFSNYNPATQATNPPTCQGNINVCAAEFADGVDQPATQITLKSSN